MHDQPFPSRRYPISAHLGRVIFAAGMTVALVFSSILLVLEYRHETAQIEEHFGIAKKSVLPRVAAALAENDRARAAALLEAVIDSTHVAAAEVRVAGASIAAVGARPPKNMMIARAFPLVPPGAAQGVPVGAPVGVLEVVIDRRRLLKDMRTLALVVVPVNILWVLAVAGFVFWAVDRRVARPLGALGRYARELGAQELSTPFNLPNRRKDAPDELDDLVAAFNAMRLRLGAALDADQTRADDAETFAARAFEYLADALIVIGADGVVRRVNPAAARMFGYAAEEMIGANVSILMPEPHRSAHDGYLARYRQTGKTNIIGQGRELEGRRKDGKIFPIDLTVAEIAGGREQLFIGAMRDLTERKRIEEEMVIAAQKARVADRTKKDFLAIMNHELRTPLNAVLGYAELMRMEAFGPLDNERYKEYLENIHRSGAHLLDLINDILDVSEIEAGRMTLREETLDPAELCRDLMRLTAARADKGGVRVENRCPGGLPQFTADERRIKQILLNLLGNAIKFNNPGGTAAIAARLAPDRAMTFVVADGGIGMTKEQLARALSPFGQADTGLDRRYEGTGLGLPLTRGLVELHGGTMTIESAPGQGTTVTVRLPPERTVPAAAPEPRPGGG